MDLETIKTWNFSKIDVRYMEHDIMHYKVKENCLISMDDVNQCLAILKELDAAKSFRNLYELGKNSKIMEDVKDWASDSEGNMQTIADAIVIQSLGHKLIANAYLKVKRPPKPTKVFTKYTDAIDWLIKQKSP
jgi:hypothetical protein